MRAGIDIIKTLEPLVNYMKGKNMKKEIEVKVLMENNYPVRVYTDHDCLPGLPLVKATLIIEVPEKRISITESEFDEAVKYADESFATKPWHERLKQKLFSKEGAE